MEIKSYILKLTGKSELPKDIELGFRVAKMGKIAYAANSRVITSGRRFQKGILHTMFEYMHSFVNMKRQKETHLSDTRI